MKNLLRLAAVPVLLIVLWVLSGAGGFSRAQVLVTATPARVTLPDVTDAAQIVDPGLASATPTRTATPQAGVFLEAAGGEVNVRAEPSTEAERYGTIRPGDRYLIRGRYFRWLQFEYPNSPTGLGWVFDELVTIIGDAALIADLSTQVTPTADPLLAAVSSGTPGAVVIQSVDQLAGSGNVVVDAGAATATPPPTYTYPPNIVAQAPTQGMAVSATTAPPGLTEISVEDGVAPIVPIAILGGLGLLGLAFSALRRR
ncbi:MAG: SH3 domain-containing protein [Chloroflexi bacterium]|nr:SH3 domain-containing protein [Chloroflexota bacterium]